MGDILKMELKSAEARRGFAPSKILLSPSPLKERGQAKGECPPHTSPYLARDVRLTKNQKGQTLIEVLIALASLGIVAVAFLTALTTASRAIIVADEHTTAESLARTELEYVKSQSFYENSWDYTVTTSGSTWSNPPSWLSSSHALPNDYAGYSTEVTAEGYDANGDSTPDNGIWKITARVYHNESPAPDDLVLTTSTYKVER